MELDQQVDIARRPRLVPRRRPEERQRGDTEATLDLDTTFERWPWDRLVQIHYAGGRWRDGVLIDSHDAATSEAVWALYDRIVARAPVKGVILERDERLPPFGDLLDEVARARATLKEHGRWG